MIKIFMKINYISHIRGKIKISTISIHGQKPNLMMKNYIINNVVVSLNSIYYDCLELHRRMTLMTRYIILDVTQQRADNRMNVNIPSIITG